MAYMDEVGGMDSPAGKAFTVTPNDSTDLPVPVRSLYVGTGGNVSVVLVGDTAPVVFTNMSAGYHPLRAKRVRATGTTATGIIGLHG